MKLDKNIFNPDFKSDKIGYSVRPINNGILIMVEIYKQDKYNECLDKMRFVKSEVIRRTNNNVNIVFANEMIEQINKYTGIEKKKDCFIEVIDILTKELVAIPLECSVCE